MEWIVWPWDWTATDWAGVQALILLVAGVIALWQATEARKLRLERSRPFVVLDLEVRQTIAEFVISNVGTTLARNVQFQFDPPLVSTFDDSPGKTRIGELSLFVHGIPSMPPGKEITLVFDHIPVRLEEGRDLPEDYDVTISYEDPLGNTYKETMTVGYSHRRDMVFVTRYDLTDIHKRLEDIAKEMKKWTVRGSAIKVMTPSSIRREDERAAEYVERIRAQAEADAAADETLPGEGAPQSDAEDPQPVDGAT